MSQADRSYCPTTLRSAATWLAAAAALVAGAVLISSVAPGGTVFVHALIYAAFGGACLVTWRRCRTAHCAITGPGFLIIALVLALGELGAWRVTAQFVWMAFAATIGAGLLFELLVAWRGRRQRSA